jgi:hypothetical protein
LHEEIEAVARDLIVCHGLDAYNKATHLSEVARSLGTSKSGKLFPCAAQMAWESKRQRRTDGAARDDRGGTT